MGTFKCPADDKGVCYFPESTLAVRGGEVSLVGPALREELLETNGFEKASRIDVVFDELMHAAIESFRAAVAVIAGGETRHAEGLVEQYPQLRSADGVIAVCQPCGDTWIV